MYNFYEYLNIDVNASNKEILSQYKNKILEYNNFDKLSKRQKYEIKMLKIGLYILTNKKLREKYNKLINIKNNEFINPSYTHIQNKDKDKLKISKLTPKNNIKSKKFSEIPFDYDSEINLNKENFKEEKLKSETKQLLNEKLFEYNFSESNIINRYDNEINMNELFNIDNSWMKNVELNTNVNKKNMIEPQILSNRVFSMPFIKPHKNNI